MFGRGPSWRPCRAHEVDGLVEALVSWPCEVGGAVRHMFQLATLEQSGHQPVRVVTDGDRWAAAVVFPGRVVAPAGAAGLIAEAGWPTRRWRLLVGDAAACDAMLDADGDDPNRRVHAQRFMTVDRDLVPSEDELSDPGLRRARPGDLDPLAHLAVQLHVDDRFGPDPGARGFRGYRTRLEESISDGRVFCVGPVGEPILKVERSVSSPRWGVQLAGIIVAPEHRGQGLGRAAVATAVRRALAEPTVQGGHTPDGERPICLHVRAANTTARRAYRAAGFVDREQWRLAVRP